MASEPKTTTAEECRVDWRDLKKALRALRDAGVYRGERISGAVELQPTSDGWLRLTAANGVDVSVSTGIGCTGHGGITRVSVGLKALAELADSAPKTGLRLDASTGAVVAGLRGSEYSAPIVYGPPLEMPSPTNAAVHCRDGIGRTIRVPGMILGPMFEKALRTAGQDTTLCPHLCCVRVESDGETVRVVSTDGHRLTVLEASGPRVDARDFVEISVPTAGAEAIARMWCSGDIVINAVNDMATIRVDESDGRVIIRSPGVFPAWPGVVPQTVDRTLVLVESARRDLEKFLRSVVAPKACVVVERAGEALSVRGERAEGSEPQSLVIPATFAGDGRCRFGINAGYMLDALRALCATDGVKLEYSGELDPIVFRPIKTDGRVVVMPARV